MSHVEHGDTVTVDYLCMIEGRLYATSLKKYAREVETCGDDVVSAPLCFKVGDGKVIEGFEKAVVGMQVGEEKTIAVAPHEGYGHYRRDLVKKYPRAIFEQKGVELALGQRLKISLPSGVLRANVINLDDRHVTLDLNHELAGKTMIFKIILRELVK